MDAALACRYESTLIRKLSVLTDEMAIRTEALDEVLLKVQETDCVLKQSYQIRDTLLTKMSELRVACDEAETLTAKKYWPFPTYGDLLFGVS